MGKVIQFPTPKKRKGSTSRRPAHRRIKYFTREEIRMIRRKVRSLSDLHLQRGNTTAVREWMMIDILSSSGLRVSEVADLRCGDLRIGYGASSLFVRNGKGGKERVVQIPGSLKIHLKKFLSWKKDRREPTGSDDHLLIGQRGPISAQGIQQIVKKHLKNLGLYEPGKSAHAFRHSYGLEHYRKNRCLRGLQLQLGHASIETTTIYADLTDEDLQDQIRGFWGGPPGRRTI